MSNLPNRPELFRPTQGRWIAGVCAGVAKRYSISPAVVRALFVLSCCLPGPQIIVYIALWILLPSE